VRSGPAVKSVLPLPQWPCWSFCSNKVVSFRIDPQDRRVDPCFFFVLGHAFCPSPSPPKLNFSNYDLPLFASTALARMLRNLSCPNRWSPNDFAPFLMVTFFPPPGLFKFVSPEPSDGVLTLTPSSGPPQRRFFCLVQVIYLSLPENFYSSFAL